MRSTIPASVILALCAASAGNVAAHEPVATGRHVRISTPPAPGRERGTLEGQVRSIDDHTIVVKTPDGDVAVPWADVQALQVATRRSRSCGALRGSVIGLVGGGVVGAAVGVTAAENQLFSKSGAAVLGAIGFGSMGAAAGGLVGIGAPCTTWEGGDPPRLTVQPVRGGVGARLSVRF